MKKLMSVILAVILCMSIWIPVTADNGVEVASLILSVKERFDIDDEKFVFEDYSKDDYGYQTTYYLTWKSRNEDEYSYNPTINVRVEADGDIEYYRIGRSYSSEMIIPTHTEDEAIEKATELIKVIAPERAKGVASGVVNDSSHYTVYFQRIVNQIPVSGDYISVNLDPETLELIRYNANWTEAEFPSPDGAISAEEAKDAYEEKIGYELLYNIVTEDRAVKEIYLSYASKAPSAYIDAFSAEAAYYSQAVYSSGGGALMNDKAAVEAAAVERTLTPEEQAMVDKINQMISKADAEKIVRSVKEFSIPGDADVTGFSVSKNHYGEYWANITFNKNSKNNYYYASASINAETKEITSFRESYDRGDNDKKYDAKKAKAKAEAFLNKYYGEKMAKVKPEFVIGEASEYSFTYDRYANGTKVKNNGISIYVDSSDGEISSFNCNWTNTEFPDNSNVVGLEKIYEDFLSDKNYNKVYIISELYDYDEITGKESRKTETHLVYAPEQTPVYSAETGVEIDYLGKPVTKAYAGYNDINGHFCENAATQLARIGIYFEGESLKPEQKVSQEEFFKFMLHAVHGISYTDKEDIFRYVVSEGIIKESEIGNDVTRMDAVKYMISAMGFKKAAEIQGIYNCRFEDVPSDLQGYAAIAGGLGIISTTPTLLRANDVLTRAECITIIHNYLK